MAAILLKKQTIKVAIILVFVVTLISVDASGLRRVGCVLLG